MPDERIEKLKEFRQWYCADGCPNPEEGRHTAKCREFAAILKEEDAPWAQPISS